jgi:hypothetical protein
MEDVPWNMPATAYGVFEPEGLCIWVNKDRQGDWDRNSVAVLSHEFTHYVHSLSTFHAAIDLVYLLFQVHSGIQRLEELELPPSLPLSDWSLEATCPKNVVRYVDLVKKRAQKIRESLGLELDSAPPERAPVGGLYKKDRKLLIKTGDKTGAPVARLSLMEGAALAKKSEILGTDEDLRAKKRNPKLSHYFAAHDACALANPRIDPLLASALLCDVSLCSNGPSIPFKRGLLALAALPASATIDDFAAQLVSVYDTECRECMGDALSALERAYDMLPSDQRGKESSWGELALRNAINAVHLRQKAPLALIRPVYMGESLLDLASKIGSPVVLSNDMRLSTLFETSDVTNKARSTVRVVSYICRWLLYDRGPLRCPYAGCPGCPEERRGAHCATNAALALLPPDDTPWCALLSAAHQLRVPHLLRSAATRA